MAEKFSPWTIQDSLNTPEDCALYLQACFLEAGDDVSFIAQAIGEVAKSRGMSQVARDAGVSREGLYKALSADGNPSFATVMGVLRALDLRLEVKAATNTPAPAAH